MNIIINLEIKVFDYVVIKFNNNVMFGWIYIISNKCV